MALVVEELQCRAGDAVGGGGVESGEKFALHIHDGSKAGHHRRGHGFEAQGVTVELIGAHETVAASRAGDAIAVIGQHEIGALFH